VSEQAGAELNARVAEVMGGPAEHPDWYWWKQTFPEWPEDRPALYAGPKFSTNIAHAMELVPVVLARLKRVVGCEVQLAMTVFPDGIATATFVCPGHVEHQWSNGSYGDTISSAICYAAIKAAEAWK